MEKAIPFTTNDVIEARFGNKKTLGGATAIVSKPKVGTPAAAPSAPQPVQSQQPSIRDAADAIISGKR